MTRALTILALPTLLTLSLVLPGGDLPRPDAEETVGVLIAYYTKSGNTRVMAEAVARGARSIAGVDVELKSVSDASPDDVLAADAIVLGSPVYNANVAPPVLEFVNSWPFRGAPLKDKLGAAFVSAGGISAGEEAVQLSLLRSMLVFGMITVGGPDWTSAFGASAVVSEGPFRKAQGGAVDEHFTKKAEALGRRVASLALRLER